MPLKKFPQPLTFTVRIMYTIGNAATASLQETEQPKPKMEVKKLRRKKGVAFFLGALIGFLCFVSISCSDKSVNAPTSIQRRFSNPYSYVGQQHNEGLDYILERIKSNGLNISGGITEGALMDKIQEYGAEFLLNKRTGGQSLDFFMQESKATLQAKVFKTNSFLSDSLSDSQQKYVKEIYDLLDSVQDTTQLAISLNDLEKQAYDDLGPENSAVVLAAGSVAYSSTVYWMNNFSQWEEALTGSSGLNKSGEADRVTNLLAIGKADVAGAVGGAIGSVTTGCAELSLGACAGAGALGGGLGASAAECILELLR